MKKVLKAILIVGILVIVVIGAAVLLLLKHMNDQNAKYWENATPSGALETKYTALGTLEVSSAEYEAADKTWQKYEIWYPSAMESGTDTYPLVIMANGTGVKASQYTEVFKHLASWGFIVAGNEDENSRTGESSAATLDYLLSLNSDPNSVFYGKIDTAHIGIAGHSQGGVGAINAVTVQANGNMYAAMWTASCTSSYHTANLGSDWSYDVSTISIPYLMVAGTGATDAGNAESKDQKAEGDIVQGICPLWSLTENYEGISDIVPKVMAREVGQDHGGMLRYADGYMTAWFMYWLNDDQSAGSAFFGDNAEILTNQGWQDVRTSITQ